jgi:hypothetical protein
MVNKKVISNFFSYFSFTFVILPGILAIVASGCGEGGDGGGYVSSTYSISGTVSGSGKQGVTITLSGSGTGTATSDESGNYSFSGLANGSYTLTLSKDGYIFSPASRSETINGENKTGVDFVASIPTFSISGTVSGSVKQGVTITLSGSSTGTATTDSNGNFSFSGLANGSYSLTSSMIGYVFSQPSLSATISGANVVDADFDASIAHDVWTWVSGDESVIQAGVYGAKGVAAASNKPGARDGSITWTDSNDDLWLFGGQGVIGNTMGTLNDLWKFDGTNWTWVSGDDTVNQAGVYGTKGVSAAANKPGARLWSISWIDESDNLWLFGGNGIDINGTRGDLNDLWKFDGTNWTWISGDNTVDQSGVYGTKGEAAVANKPGGRQGSISWTDSSGNFWLFGGGGFDMFGVEGSLNDLWKFDGTNWTWVSGNNSYALGGVYGTKGVTEDTNVPGGRFCSTGWIDASDNLWLFGGTGFDFTNTPGYLNDLWKFDGTNWTWVSGDDTVDHGGVYGTKGVAAGTNKPGSRRYSISWMDSSDNLWFFGGEGFDANDTKGYYLNDLWKFDGTDWTWVSGDDTTDHSGVYGTKGVTTVTNKPGGRHSGISWIDTKGFFWLFGGNGFDVNNTNGDLNDLWVYVP